MQAFAIYHNFFFKLVFSKFPLFIGFDKDPKRGIELDDNKTDQKRVA